MYEYEIGKGTTVVNPSMKSLRKGFKPAKGFGGNPLEKESFWRLTPAMVERIERYKIKKEIEDVAKGLGLKNYDIRLANNILEKRQLGTTKYSANLISGADPKQHEIAIAEILEKNGHKVLFTPENTFIKIKNPEGLLIDKDQIIEMKRIDSPDINKIEKRIKKSSEQYAEISIIHLDADMPYSKKNAIAKAREALKADANNLKEVWLIWKGKINRLKK